MMERVTERGRDALDWLGARTLFGLLALARVLPAGRSLALAEWIGRRFAPVLPRTGLAKRNMALAYPDASPAEIDGWARAVWGSTTRMVGEFVHLDELIDIDPDRPERGRVEVRGMDNALALRDRRGPAIVFTAHTGNWEILPAAAASVGLEVTALFRPPNNRFVAERLLAARRTAAGALVPSRAGAARSLVEVLEGGGTVGLLVDQWFARGVPVTFLGRETRANPLAAKLARRFDCPVHPGRCVRLPGGRFRVEIEDALVLPRDVEGRIDVHEATQTIANVVERWVREHPDQWFWLHKRWK